METKKNPTTFTFINADGLRIAYKCWHANDNLRGNILIIHGLNSHSGYYHNFAWQLVENDFEVYAIDLRGRGQSEGERYYIADYIALIDDIHLLVKTITIENPITPIFLFGHGIGSLLASTYAVLHKDKLAGLISESIHFQLHTSKLTLKTIILLSRLIPHMRLIKLNNKLFSRDKSIIDIMNNDPLLASERQSPRTIQQIFVAAQSLKKGIPQIQLPILILHGTGDRVAKPGGSKYYMDYCASTDKQFNLYEGHYHDLLNDKYNTIIIKDIIRWINKRI